MSVERFVGWITTCPHCGWKEYTSDEEIISAPKDDTVHIIQCKECLKEFDWLD